MAKHSHRFVETYRGLAGMGMNRQTDEDTVVYCLQKFSDDRVMACLRKRLTDHELHELFNVIMKHLKNHLTEEEYHCLFLKDNEMSGD